MKLCKLTFKNINSLAGKWEIDFEDPAYKDGLFAITGPTGAGKTTILDALCLALYGCTPRISNLSKKTNEIMTRNTDECSAEATFEVDGKRYLAKWSQRRSNNDTEYKFEQAEHGIDRTYPDATNLAEMTEKTKEIVKNICHLDYKRFIGTVLIPQGGFEAFLKAKPGDRAKILEELTGGQIYRAISSKVNELTSKEETKLSRIEGDLKKEINIPMPDEKREEIQERFDRADDRISALRKEIVQATEALDWYNKAISIKQEETSLKDAEDQNRKDSSDFEPKKQELESSERAWKAKDLHDHLEKGRQTKDYLEKARVKAVKEMEEARQKLQIAISKSDSAEKKLETEKQNSEKLDALLKTVQDLDTRIKGKKDSAEELSRSITRHKKDWEKYSRDEADAAKTTAEAEKKHSALQAELNAALQAQRQADIDCNLGNLASELAEGQPCPLCGSVHHPSPYGTLHSQEIEVLKQAAARAEEKVKKLQKRVAESNNDLMKLKTEISVEGTKKNRSLEDYEQSRSDLEKIKAELASLEKERYGLFSDKDTEKERMAQKENLNNAEKAQRSASGEKSNADNRAILARSTFDSLKEQLERNESDLQENSRKFSERIASLGFVDEEAWKDSLMSENYMESLRKQKQDIEDRAQELKDKRNILESKKNDLSKRATPELPYEGLSKRKEDLEEERDKAISDKKADETALENDSKVRERRAKLQDDYKRQKNECDIWKDLNKRIGSYDGSKFPTIVQAFTCRHLVRAANEQLKTLSNRYLLRMSNKDKKNPLDFDIVDKWNGNNIRSIDNLSGGERFIVSLALALALSHGMKLKIDSLFLDEGFGTLDEDSLNTVIDSLSALQQTGKTIGIISHVAALQERIRTHISVRPADQGHSTISGPGCRKLAEVEKQDNKRKKSKTRKKKNQK